MFLTRNVVDARKRLEGLKNQHLRSRQVVLYKIVGGRTQQPNRRRAMPWVQSQVVLYKTLETAALVAEMPSLLVALDRQSMSLAIALLVTGMRVSPLLSALPHNLGVDGVGTDLSLVIFPPSLTLAGKLTANLLLGMVRGSLKKLLAITATAQTHQNGSGSESDSLILSRDLIQFEAARQKFSPCRIACRVFTASPRMGLLIIKPQALMLFLVGADRPQLHRAHCGKAGSRGSGPAPWAYQPDTPPAATASELLFTVPTVVKFLQRQGLPDGEQG